MWTAALGVVLFVAMSTEAIVEYYNEDYEAEEHPGIEPETLQSSAEMLQELGRISDDYDNMAYLDHDSRIDVDVLHESEMHTRRAKRNPGQSIRKQSETRPKSVAKTNGASQNDPRYIAVEVLSSQPESDSHFQIAETRDRRYSSQKGTSRKPDKFTKTHSKEKSFPRSVGVNNSMLHQSEKVEKNPKSSRNKKYSKYTEKLQENMKMKPSQYEENVDVTYRSSDESINHSPSNAISESNPTNSKVDTPKISVIYVRPKELPIYRHNLYNPREIDPAQVSLIPVRQSEFPAYGPVSYNPVPYNPVPYNPVPYNPVPHNSNLEIRNLYGPQLSMVPIRPVQPSLYSAYDYLARDRGQESVQLPMIHYRPKYYESKHFEPSEISVMPLPTKDGLVGMYSIELVPPGNGRVVYKQPVESNEDILNGNSAVQSTPRLNALIDSYVKKQNTVNWPFTPVLDTQKQISQNLRNWLAKSPDNSIEEPADQSVNEYKRELHHISNGGNAQTSLDTIDHDKDDDDDEEYDEDGKDNNAETQDVSLKVEFKEMEDNSVDLKDKVVEMRNSTLYDELYDEDLKVPKFKIPRPLKKLKKYLRGTMLNLFFALSDEHQVETEN